MRISADPREAVSRRPSAHRAVVLGWGRLPLARLLDALALVLVLAVAACGGGGEGPGRQQAPEQRAPGVGPLGIFANLSIPDGIATDRLGNVYVYHFTLDNWRVTKLAPDGAVVWSSIAGGLLEPTARLALDPLTDNLLLLSEAGQMSIVDTQRGTVVRLLHLLQLPWDNSGTYDMRTGRVVRGDLFVPPCLAPQPALCQHKFGDIAVHSRADVIDWFITGRHTGIPFVLRVRRTASNPAFQIRPILVSSAVNPFTGSVFNYARGIAASPQGSVLTTLPFEHTAGNPIDVPVLFNADFEPAAGPGPLVIGNPAAGGLTSKGMTSDAAGNFYVATGAVGAPVCGFDASGALVTVSADGKDIRCAATLGIGLADSRDVALTPAGNRVYMTLASHNVVLFFPSTAVPGRTPTP